ncbi:tyrosine-type recombinase/integrase [Halarcobacter anaerophilus]|uniref:tyrosine-type recombinase/integrase n=1 Tax=Halarcobacter anaerophilus TaxID=877500 RepID=UPI0005C92FD5|nr:integrase arm-type DNA-binding domain-containing protein [Halarcobacter anaerophilus]
MPKITKPLTDTEIKKAKPKDKAYKLSDGQSMYLVVQKNGTKFFRFDFSFANKRQSMSFGIYPDISLKEARQKREHAKEKIKKGINPIDFKKADYKLENNLKYITDKWLEHNKPSWAEKTYEKIKNNLYNNLLISIGTKNMKDITRLDIINVVKVVEQRGAFEVATRLLNYIERIYKYAITYNYAGVEHNIVADIEKRNVINKPKVKHHKAIIKEEELKKLLIDIKEYKNDFRATISTIYALQLAPYVAFRPYNIRFLEWEEINWENRQIEISGDKMKAKKDFIMPLSTQAYEILREAEQFRSSKYVFPSQITNSKPISENTLNQAIKRMGYTNMTSHGFRSTFSTNAHEKIYIHNFNSDIIETALAHEQENRIKAAYNRDSRTKYLNERRELMQWWADWLDNL